MYSIDHTANTMQLPTFLKEVTNHSFVTEVPDNSMAPEFRAGDHIHVDLDLKPIDGCFVVAILAGTTVAVLRQYEGRGDDGFTLRAFDSDYPSLGVDSEVDATIVGAVIERYRSILPRTVSVEE